MASLYTREANRRRIAEGSASKLMVEKENIYSRTHAKGAGEIDNKSKEIK